MKKTAIFSALFFCAFALVAQNRSYPPYDPIVMPTNNMTWNEFWGNTENRIRSNFQMAAGFSMSKFFEIRNWEQEDKDMVDWVHNNVIIDGTTNKREVGDTWELLVDRFEDDGWLVLLLWHPPADGGGWYQYRLFYWAY